MERVLPRNLGTLPDSPTLVQSDATAINNLGQVVGTSSTAICTGDDPEEGSGEYQFPCAFRAVMWTLTQPPASPREQIQQIKVEVDDLITHAALNKGQGNALTTKLDGALAKLDRGNTKAAANQLRAFVNQVQAFRKSKKLTTSQAQLLIDAANRVIEELRK